MITKEDIDKLNEKVDNLHLGIDLIVRMLEQGTMEIPLGNENRFNIKKIEEEQL